MCLRPEYSILNETLLGYVDTLVVIGGVITYPIYVIFGSPNAQMANLSFF